MSRTLFVTDLDGTLLDADSVVSPRSRLLLNEAISEGALFSVATARTPATVAPLLEGIDVRLPVAVMTGAALWNPADGIYSDVCHIPTPAVDDILRIYRRVGLPSFVYLLRDNHVEIYHQGPFSEEERLFMKAREGSPFKEFHVGPEGESEMPDPLSDVILLFTMQPTALVDRAYDAIIEEGIPCNPLHYHDIYGPAVELMEVFAADASKGEAVMRLKRAAGADRLVVFGDNVNDIPMMRRADVAVAVGNAVDEVKEVADIVIGPNTDDAVPRFILQESRLS